MTYQKVGDPTMTSRSRIVLAFAVASLAVGCAPTIPASILGGCKPWECGSNGAWLGNNIVFHELDADGKPNGVGLVVVDFEDKLGHKMKLDVDHDRLIGKTPNGPIEGQALADVGATIWLRRGSADVGA